MQAASHQIHPNNHQKNESNDPDEPLIASESNIIDINKLRLPVIKPSKLLGYNIIKNINGNHHEAIINEMLPNNDFLVEIDIGNCEDIMTYNEFLEHKYHEEKNTNAKDKVRIFEEVLDHRKDVNGKY